MGVQLQKCLAGREGAGESFEHVVTCRYGYYTPAPFNLWMNVADKPDTSGYIWVMPPGEQKAGDYCIFRAEEDLVAAMSACPWDLGDM